MATSFGAAAAQGLQTGFGMAMDLHRLEDQRRREKRQEEMQEREFRERQQQRDFERERALREDARREREDARRIEDDALKAIEAEMAMLRGDMAGYYRSGQKDEAREKEYLERARDVSARRLAVLRKKYAPIIERTQQAARDINSRLQSGQVSLRDLSGEELLTWIEGMTRRDPRDFLRGEGGKSRVGAAVEEVVTGLETNNEGMLLRGVNVVLEPELKIGVGGSAKDGAEITGKEVYKLIPNPTNPGLVMPVLRVRARRADGAEGGYLAPITRGRTSREDDEVHPGFDLKRGFDVVGALGVFEEAVNDPVVRRKVEEALAERGGKPSDFLSAFLALGGKDEDLVSKRKQVSRERVDLGGEVLEREVDDTGRVIKETRLRKSAAPRIFAPRSGGSTAAGITLTERLIDEALAAGEITPEEAREERAALRRRLVESGGKGGNPPPSTGERTTPTQAGNEAERVIAGELGLRRENGRWVDGMGRPAKKADLERLAAAREAAARNAKLGISAALDAAREEAGVPRRAAAGQPGAARPVAPTAPNGKDYSHLWRGKQGPAQGNAPRVERAAQ